MHSFWRLTRLMMAQLWVWSPPLWHNILVHYANLDSYCIIRVKLRYLLPANCDIIITYNIDKVVRIIEVVPYWDMWCVLFTLISAVIRLYIVRGNVRYGWWLRTQHIWKDCKRLRLLLSLRSYEGKHRVDLSREGGRRRNKQLQCMHI